MYSYFLYVLISSQTGNSSGSALMQRPTEGHCTKRSFFNLMDCEEWNGFSNQKCLSALLPVGLHIIILQPFLFELLNFTVIAIYKEICFKKILLFKVFS